MKTNSLPPKVTNAAAKHGEFGDYKIQNGTVNLPV